MSSLFETLTQQLGGTNLKALADQVGADERQTGTAMAAALPMLLGALAKNAAKPDGAAALHRALEKDHDGSLMDNVSGFLGQSQSGPGEGILRHLLGGRRQAVESGLSKSTGMSAQSVSKLMVALAPVVLGALGRQQRERKMNSENLAGFLGEERQGIQTRAPQAMGMLGMLDADGDGDVDVNDIAKKGMGMLGNMFKR